MIDIEIKENKNCTGCYACFNICPQNCIAMESDGEGFSYPKVNYDKCIKCGLCVRICPTINKRIVDNNPVAYACFNKDEFIRLQSSSGGIFTLVAEEIINRNGLVFGAGFDKDFRVIHSYIESNKDLRIFRGSKYVQSKIGNTYKQAKDFLEEGREVLFTGTPCQIGGLKSYLGKDYDNLLCLDIICHGVPSPKVWSKYVAFRENRAGSPAQRIAFRLKDEGWKRYSVSFVFNNDTEYRKNLREDLYMRAFLKDVCLRPSCYACEFKTLHRESDITLADFWGVQNLLPEMDDDKGISLIFINSAKGQLMLENIKDRIAWKEVDINQAVRYNSAAIRSVAFNPNRKNFFSELDTLKFDKLVGKYTTDKLSVKIKKRIMQIGIYILKNTGTLNLAKSVLRKI